MAILEKRFWKKDKTAAVDKRIFGKKVGLIWKFFGCGHEKLSRPISRAKIGYQSCLKCGALKPFDTETLQSFKSFYYPPIIKSETVKNINI